MNSLSSLLAEAIDLAEKLGFTVRHELLDGAGGGHCILSMRKLLLLDVTQSDEEQLADVVDALRGEIQLWKHPVSPQLASRVQLTQAA
ncbi:MAG: hypothetical protein KF688_02960 [Pirellulales bacterium]|nr:hypothetical protein [Pirellulales bacterium]